MLDFETLGTNTDSVILTMGLIKFNPTATGIIERLEIRPTIEDQTEIYNRTIDEATLEWWSRQSPEAIEASMGDQGRVSFSDAMSQLSTFCWNSKAVWSNGSVFDIIMAEHALKSLNMRTPWQFWTIRDCRTIYDLCGVSLKDEGAKTSHLAVDDAEKQAILVQKCYAKLKNAGFNHLR